MKGKRLLTLLGSVCLVLILAALSFVAACAPEEVAPPPPPPEEEEEEEAPPPPPELPERVSVSTWAMGTTAYTKAVALAGTVQDSSGMRVITEGIRSDFARVEASRKGDIELLYTSTSTTFLATDGEFDFEPVVKEYGPYAFRVVWGGEMANMGLIVRGDSGIKTPADLKGKRLAFLAGKPPDDLPVLAYLAYANLTEDDITRLEYPWYNKAVEAVKEEKSDAAYGNPVASYCLELEASPHGIGLVEVAAPEKGAEAAAGWERLNAIARWLYPTTIVGLPGCREKPVDFSCVGTAWFAFPFLDDNVAYAVAKGIHEGYDQFKDVHPDLPKWTLESCLDVWKISGAPLHPGTIQYFKDAGIWTAELEALQDEMLKAEKDRIAAWEEETGKKYRYP